MHLLINQFIQVITASTWEHAAVSESSFNCEKCTIHHNTLLNTPTTVFTLGCVRAYSTIVMGRPWGPLSSLPLCTVPGSGVVAQLVHVWVVLGHDGDGVALLSNDQTRLLLRGVAQVDAVKLEIHKEIIN